MSIDLTEAIEAVHAATGFNHREIADTLEAAAPLIIRQAKAEALREAAESFRSQTADDSTIAQWLDDRADRIEQAP